MNEPFLLRPSAKDYLWGGNRINEVFGKGIDMSPLAETWECSVHPDGPSYAVGGKFDGMALADILKNNPEFLGDNIGENKEFPILIKFIDAKKDLSVQVHPSDEYAKKYENGQNGKTEMWYVLDAEKGATLVYGMKAATDKETIRKAINEGKLEDYLQKVEIKKGDVFFIEAGTVHAIGAGALIAEIQQNSNLTYRMYDYDRVDKNGNKRELHIDKAIAVADLKPVPQNEKQENKCETQVGMKNTFLAGCKYFNTSKLDINTESGVDFKSDKSSYKVLLCIDGNGKLTFGEKSMDIKIGNCIFVPANSYDIKLSGNMQLLYVTA